MTITSAALRERFLEFFSKHRHHIEKSAPLIPHDDPTLLFVNAGMVQFKNVFTKKETRPYTRAATSQKCVRAGGKHNDLENVGRTARHHTFFEMLGNFSFGDYFKEDAIKFAWAFLTEDIKLDPARLSVSVFAGDAQVPADDEALRIWRDVIGVPEERIKKLGREDNFWQMGDTGPCGPCSEIHYDRSDIHIGFGGEEASDKNVEIWNLVFMQYEMKADGSLTPLPAPCVDTGMGLERLACVINNLRSNYDTDLLRPLIGVAEMLTKKSYGSTDSDDDVAMRVIADHARAAAFLIADGLFPSNEGRGYVLRRFMRRAIRHGAHLGLRDPFFHHVCLKVIDLMGAAYPELHQALPLIEKVVVQEEESFRKTLDRGLILFQSQIKELKPQEKLGGDVVFRLYETYGFPPDLTEDLAKAASLSIDWEAFARAQKEHEQRSAQGLGLKGVDDIFLRLAEKFNKTEFSDREHSDGKVLAILKEQVEVTELKNGESGIIILDRTSLYGESGGQIGDTGRLTTTTAQAVVNDTKKAAGLNLHFVTVTEGAAFKINDHVTSHVDWQRRQAIRRNHSATHLLHSALRTVLGTHVIQKGSLVAPARLRFDFAHFSAMTKEEIASVEDLVNRWILDNEEAKIHDMTMDEAKAHGALALFGEKYESRVRVLDMGTHSTELCGGTHCHRTGDIGSFRIVSEGPLAQGIRRMEAITGMDAVNHSRSSDLLLKELSGKLGVKADSLAERIEQLVQQVKASERAIKSQSASSLKDRADSVVENALVINGIKVVTQHVDFIDNPEDLRTYADLIRDRIEGVVGLGVTQGDKCTLIVAISSKLAGRFHAGKIVSEAALLMGGKGGGRPDFAQAGGANVKELPTALKKIVEIVGG